MKPTTRGKPTARPAGGRLDVYDGQTHVGTVEPVQGGFLARDVRGRALGTHPTHREAMRAMMTMAVKAG